MNLIAKAMLIALGCLAATLGIVGVFVPVLPTTPLLLLAAFCFSKSSQRFMNWLEGTKAYRSYVAPFKANGGITRRKKIRIVALSYAVMAVSALLVQRLIVWAILLAVALFLAWLMLVRIPTIEEDEAKLS